MSKWPKTWICEPWHDEGEGYDAEMGTPEVIEAPTRSEAERLTRKRTNAEDPICTEVIPADLGRELYEALKDTQTDDMTTAAGADAKAKATLARYEREVGS